MNAYYLTLALFLSAGSSQAPPVRDVPWQAPPIRDEAPVLPPIRVREALPKTYRESGEVALRRGVPLVVWSGSAVCLPCVKGNMDEFSMFVGRPTDNFPKDGLTVFVPVQGELVLAGTVEEWPDGHIPTVREILRRWRETRTVTTRILPPGSPPWREGS